MHSNKRKALFDEIMAKVEVFNKLEGNEKYPVLELKRKKKESDCEMNIETNKVLVDFNELRPGARKNAFDVLFKGAKVQKAKEQRSK